MKSEQDYPVIIDAVRSPVGMKKGKMLGLRADELMARVLVGLLGRNPNIQGKYLEDVIIGCAFPEGVQGMLLARGASILAGLPTQTAAKIVNRFCGSSMDALHQLDYAIGNADAKAGIAGGVGNMFSIPMGGYNPSFHPELYKKQYYIGMGDTAENLAREGEISRQIQEDFAINSHIKALAAWKDGRFTQEVIPISVNGHTIDKDEGPREPDIAKIKSLEPTFDASGTVTAATSSPYSIGAAAILMTGKQVATKLDLQPLAKIVSRAVAGVDWTRMGMGPLPATEKALKRAGLILSDIDVIELNEAFAAQSLYVIQKGKWPEDKINLNVMEQQDVQLGLATMCIGGGQGIATILERC
jgi:acetyl-CoA acyltransferase